MKHERNALMIQTSKKGEYLEVHTPPNWNGLSIEALFKEHYHAPKKLIHSWRMNKDVFVNGKHVPWNTPLKIGDKILLPLFKYDGSLPKMLDKEIKVLYEDEHLLIVNKPAGLDTHPSNQDEHNSLLNAVAYHLLLQGEICEVRHIHRLDKDTTGAIIFSKNAFVAALLQQMLEERSIKRTYKALVHGRIRQKKGTINANIGRDRHHATRRRVSQNGQTAITHFKTLNYDQTKNLTLVECTLETGRTHQIRVHFSHIGHPLAGDILYGGKPIYTRQALHAYKINMVHPITEVPLEVIAPFIDQPAIFIE